MNLLIAEEIVRVAKKKLNGNFKTVRLPDALTRYWFSKAQEIAALKDHMHTRSKLFPSHGMICHLVDHVERDDITFNHIHGDHDVSSTSLTRCYQDVLSFWSFGSRRKTEPKEKCWENNNSLSSRFMRVV